MQVMGHSLLLDAVKSRSSAIAISFHLHSENTTHISLELLMIEQLRE
jgi:hypothetical protein